MSEVYDIYKEREMKILIGFIAGAIGTILLYRKHVSNMGNQSEKKEPQLSIENQNCPSCGSLMNRSDEESGAVRFYCPKKNKPFYGFHWKCPAFIEFYLLNGNWKKTTIYDL